ncbi:MAG: hypothetical protein KKD73_13670 [Proteobacteria bacterium]|nr:hypothetical protein [Pseudomonadota bacterium]MBU1640443.1 hypothetical protein [Pseudomonadota bacterium]
MPQVAGGGQDLTANWSHSDGKDEVATDEYFLTYTLDLKQEVTEAMSLQESMRYSSGWREEYDTQSVDPSMRFGISNDLFVFELFGSASQQRNTISADQKRASWEAVWASSWEKRFWPNLRTTYGEDFQEDDNSPRLTDSENKNESVALDWDFELFKTYFNYNRNKYNNIATDRQSDSTSNFARLEADHSLWQNRLTFGFANQFSENREKSTTALGTTSSALIRQSLSQVLHGLDVAPLTITTAGELNAVAALHDGDLTTASSVATNGIDVPSPHSIAMKTDFKIIDEIYLYTAVDRAAVAASFTFALYTSDNGSNWQLSTNSLPFSYNSAEKRFEFPIPALNNLWLKLVITSSPLTTVDFTEIEAYQRVTGVDKAELTSTSSSMITDLNLGARLTDTLTLTYNLSFENGEYGSGVEYDRSSQAGHLTWQTLAALTTTVGVNESKSQNGDADESSSRSYTLNMDAIPLDTVDVNMGLTRSEEYEGSERQSVNHNVGLFTTAALYPDLDASVDLNYGWIKQEDTDLTTRNYHTILTLTARLVPSVTADLTTDYQHTLGDDGSETTGADLSINWRASDMLSMHVSGNKEWLGSDSQSEGASVSLSLAPTDTTQFSMNYIYAKAINRIDKYSLFGSWSLGPHFTIQGNGSYSESQGEEEWLVQSQLVARFSVM